MQRTRRAQRTQGTQRTQSFPSDRARLHMKCFKLWVCAKHTSASRIRRVCLASSASCISATTLLNIKAIVGACVLFIRSTLLFNIDDFCCEYTLSGCAPASLFCLFGCAV